MISCVTPTHLRCLRCFRWRFYLFFRAIRNFVLGFVSHRTANCVCIVRAWIEAENKNETKLLYKILIARKKSQHISTSHTNQRRVIIRCVCARLFAVFISFDCCWRCCCYLCLLQFRTLNKIFYFAFRW